MPPVNEANTNPEGGAEKINGLASAVFRIKMHCEGCAKKIKRIVRSFEGVEDVDADLSSDKLTVIGNVDFDKLRDKLAEKTKRNVQLAVEDETLLYKDDDPAPVVFKLQMHCDDCIRKIRRIVRRFGGVEDVIADLASNKLTVTGKVDANKLRENLAAKTKRKVELAMENLLYEVFISFRGEDTRSSFTSHLHAALQNAAINVFIDDRSLERGEDISSSLPQAIEQSQISVIVLSQNYADSQWCMDELVRIMKCRRTIRQVVLPVFYGVDPSEVRQQTGEFGKAFQSLLSRCIKRKGPWNRSSIGEDELPNRVLTWRAALQDAAGLAGFVVLNSR